MAYRARSSDSRGEYIYVVCRRGFDTCKMVNDLRDSARIQTLMNKKSFIGGRFEVDATLCDHLADYNNFTEEEFVFEAYTCDNHFLGIRASQRRNTLSSQIF